MTWKQLSFHCPQAEAEALSAQLTELGAVAVTLQDDADQPLFEPGPGETPLWQSVCVTGLFEDGIDSSAIVAAIRTTLGEHLSLAAEETVEDRAWERAWMDDYHPMQFGQRLWIVPTDYTAPDPQAVNLLLDPGLAFGTGTHPTTALCLRWLDAHPPQGQTVIDYGCGSGILGIAALRLGARHVDAVDIDPQALQATRDNAARNGVDENIATMFPPQLSGKPVDLVLANILAGPLVELAPALAAYVKPEGRIVLSGLLETQSAQIVHVYEEFFKNINIAQDEEWIRIDAQRQ